MKISIYLRHVGVTSGPSHLNKNHILTREATEISIIVETSVMNKNDSIEFAVEIRQGLTSITILLTY